MPQTNWPTAGEFVEALFAPRYCFEDPILKSGTVSTNRLSLPLVWSGQFAVVSQVKSSGKLYAVRCFTRPVVEQRERYTALHNAFMTNGKPESFLDFEYLQKGILVNSNWYPIVKMSWANGQTLDQYVDTLVNRKDKAGLLSLSEAWFNVVCELRSYKIAHNDFQHENILVDNGRIHLVDYDGMFVPSLSGRNCIEAGIPHYQHPRRSLRDFNENIDNFPALVIYLSLRALAVDLSLWGKYHQDRRLILSEQDYKNPANSKLLNELKNSPDPEVIRLSQVLINACTGPITNVPALDKVVNPKNLPLFSEVVTQKSTNRAFGKEHPFYFRNGGTASSLPQFISLCRKRPGDAGWHLTQGHFEPWLKDLGYTLLAKTAGSIRLKIKNEKQAIESFLDTFPKNLLIVSKDESSDFRNLEDAIRAAKSGGNIYLAQGTYTLKEGVFINQPITILGENKEFTKIVTKQGNYVLKYDGVGTLELSNLTFRWTGDESEARNVVIVQKGDVQITNCVFCDAPSIDKNYGMGLVLSGSAQGEVRGCIFRNNGFGIRISERAQPNLFENICSKNKSCGISYYDNASGIARQNKCETNENYGIYLSDEAHPTLDRNTCTKNTWSGISYNSKTSGTALQNICTLNGTYGISVAGDAQPNLEENICRSNQWSGIRYSGTAKGTVRQNLCEANETHGIVVDEHAMVILTGNKCLGNKGCGIGYFDETTGTARQNICQLNEQHGIYLAEQAHPTLEENSSEKNKWSGITFTGSASGTARQNTCKLNDQNGFSINAKAQPDLQENICQANKISGIKYSDNAKGTARQNTCTLNERHGISLSNQAQPVLIGNNCLENKDCGISFYDDTAGTSRQNNCKLNEHHGIYLAGQAHPTLEENFCEKNKWTGISFNDSASGAARQNNCKLNDRNGFFIDDEAHPDLWENICQANKTAGIKYSGNAKGTARQNICKLNETHGISLSDQAQPNLDSNTCEKNKSCGIAFYGSAGGISRQNICSSNENYGIYVCEQAQPNLEKNTCNENLWAGISYQDTAAGTARMNVCKLNKNRGIYVSEQAKPVLIDNIDS